MTAEKSVSVYNLKCAKYLLFGKKPSIANHCRAHISLLTQKHLQALAIPSMGFACLE